MEFYALFVTLVAVVLTLLSANAVHARVQAQKRSLITVAAPIIAILALTYPSPALSRPFGFFVQEYRDVRTGIVHPNDYEARVEGYSESQELCAALRQFDPGKRVLAVGYEDLAYYFRHCGVQSVGDWVGPGRYSELRESVESGRLVEYLRAFNVGAVMFSSIPRTLTATDAAQMERQLRDGGFRLYSGSGAQVVEYVDRRAADRLAAEGRMPTIDPNSIYLDRVFSNGEINSNAKVDTPTGRGALLSYWRVGMRSVRAITIVSGFSYSFAVRLSPHSQFVSTVGKAFQAGIPAIAWIDVQARGHKTRVWSTSISPADGTHIYWHSVRVSLGNYAGPAIITLGVSSAPGGGIADWGCFTAPRITNATLAAAAIEQLHLKRTSADFKRATVGELSR